MKISKNDWQKISADFSMDVPAANSTIEEVEASLGAPLPSEYKEFLSMTNGAEGPIGKTGYIALWPAGQLKENNDGYEVDRYVPGLLLIGSDGGGEAFAFDLSDPDRPVVSIPFVGMNRNLLNRVGASFWDFLLKYSRL